MGWKRKRLEAMDDEDLYDVHLIGTDGEEVPCCKAILATVSPVFKSMFFRGFKEQRTDRCNLDFHSLVISLIVKYCYCGEMDMEDLNFSEENRNLSLQDEASTLVELREAGRYFEIEDLFSTAEAKIGSLVFQENENNNKKYQYTLAFLSELFKREEDKEPLGLVIFRFAVENTMACFGPKALEGNDTADTYHVHPGVLSNVLDKNEDLNTYSIVRCLQAWFSLESKRDAENRYSDEEKRGLLEICENIDLKELSTRELSNVKPCSLFSSERILAAFVHHCKRPEEIIAEAPRRAKPSLYISGAGMEYLNGVYEQTRSNYGEKISMFFKRVEHNGIDCKSVVHFRHRENKWLISITNSDLRVESNFRGQMSSYIELQERCVQMHAYESSYLSPPTEIRKVPPFNNWKCVEGSTGPGPLVACINKPQIQTRVRSRETGRPRWPQYVYADV